MSTGETVADNKPVLWDVDRIAVSILLCCYVVILLSCYLVMLYRPENSEYSSYL